MRSQRAFLRIAEDLNEPETLPGRAAISPNDGRRATPADYEETYLDWPPRRRKSGPDRADRHQGALRRLRRALR